MKQHSLEYILENVCNAYINEEITPEQMKGPSRVRPLPDARAIYSNIALSFTRATLEDIALVLRMDHSSICAHERKHKQLYRSDRDYTNKYNYVERLINPKLLSDDRFRALLDIMHFRNKKLSEKCISLQKENKLLKQ